MARQARGLARNHKAGLEPRKKPGPKPGPRPTSALNDAKIDALNAKVIAYLETQLVIFLETGGCHKEVMQIGRALLQLRSKPSGDPPDNSSDEPDLVDPRTLFAAPPE